MDAEAGPSRRSARRSARNAAPSDTIQLSRLAAMSVDEDSDEAEFGALAFGTYDEDEDDSNLSEPEWDDEDASDASAGGSRKAPPKKPPRKASTSTRTAGASSQHLMRSRSRHRATRGDTSNDEDEDDVEDSAAEEAMNLDGLDPQLFGHAGPSRPRLREDEADDAEADFEPESFQRLVSLLQDTSREAGALRQRWDTSIEAENAEFENELRAAAGFKQKRRARRKAHEQPLSPEVQTLLADANMAYVEHRLYDAIPKLEEVIRIEPNVKTAWKTLGLIYQEVGEEEKSIQCRIIGAHLDSGASEEWKSLAYRSIAQMLYRQAIYCFQQAIKINKADIDSIWDRALLLRDLGDYKAAMNGMLDILKLQSYDASVVQELVPMLVSTGDYDRGIEVLERWRKSSMEAFPSPTTDGLLDPALTGADEAQTASQPVGTAPTSNNFRISELVTLADLMLLTRKPLETVTLLRQTARWLDGRVNEDFWDPVNDDREFDGDIDPQIRKERDQEGYGRQVENAEPRMLDPEIRLRLGKARMMLGDVAEAKHHFDILTEGDPGDRPQIFAEVGDCYYEHRFWPEALDVLTDLATTEYATDEVSLYAKLAACNHVLGELEEAARLYEPVVEASPDTLEWQMRLAEVYEGLGEKEKSLEVLQQVMRILQMQREAEAQAETASGTHGTAQSSNANDSTLSFFDEMGATPASKASSAKRARMNYNREQRLKLEAQREQETQLAWRRLELLDPHVFVEGFWRHDVAINKEGEEAMGPFYTLSENADAREKRYRQTAQWLEEASSLIDAFRLNPRLNGHHLKRRRPGGNRTAAGRQRRQEAIASGTLASLLNTRGGGGPSTISTQAKNLLHRLQDQLVEDEATSDLGDGSEAGDTSRQRAEPGPKQLDMSKFRGLPIEHWIALFAKYCFLLVKSGEPITVVNTLLQSLHTSAVVWGLFDRMLVVQLAWLSCALYVQDWPTVWSAVRWLAQEMQFHNLPLKLGASLANATGFHSLGKMIGNNDIKFYQRRMRSGEAVARGAECRFSTTNKRWQVPVAVYNSMTKTDGAGYQQQAGDEGEDGEGGVHAEDSDGAASLSDEPAAVGSALSRDIKGDRPDPALAIRLARPTKPSPLAELHYGYMLLYSGGFQSSAAFFGRAFAIQPTDALLCLVAATAFLGRSTNRQTDNRHHMILTALSFLQSYRKYREQRRWAETEYNAARALHHVGLVHLAERRYRNVLEYDGEREGWGMKSEAAWNLALIYTTSGSADRARELYERYLAV